MKKLKLKIKSILMTTINLFTIKHKNRIYVRYYKRKCSDIINNGHSNTMRFLDKYLHTARQKKIIVYLEYFDNNRLNDYLLYAKEVDKFNVDLRFIKSYHIIKNRIKRFIVRFKNLKKQYSAKTWICDTGDAFYEGRGKLRCQKVFCINYFIPCKNDLLIGNNFRWSYLESIVTTSLLASQITSATIGVKLDKCHPIGFPRNDTLFERNKEDQVLSWIINKVGYTPKKIILYVPTFRDYELKNSFPKFFTGNNITIKENQGRYLLGYETEGLEELLKENETVLIHSLHPLQQVDVIKENSGIIAYENNYDFTLYDLMAISDCVISDYSSIAYDFLLLDRPLIFNLYDLDKYVSQRGLSYEPFEYFCPGHIVKKWEDMKNALLDVITENDNYKEKRKVVRNLLHKYQDGNSTERVMKVLRNS